MPGVTQFAPILLRSVQNTSLPAMDIFIISLKHYI